MAEASPASAADLKELYALFWHGKTDEAVAALRLGSDKARLLRDQNGNTLLHVAAEKGNLALADALLEAGADLNARNRRKYTPIATSIVAHQYAASKHLALAGAAVESVTSEEKSTVLHLLLLQDCPEEDTTAYLEFLQFLLSLRPELVSSYNTEFESPLHIACLRGHESAVKLLLDKGAPINALAKSGESPIFYAARLGHVSIVRLLVERKADLSVVGTHGTLSDVCARSGSYLDMMAILGGSEPSLGLLPLENGPLCIPPRCRRWSEVRAVYVRNLIARPLPEPPSAPSFGSARSSHEVPSAASSSSNPSSSYAPSALLGSLPVGSASMAMSFSLADNVPRLVGRKLTATAVPLVNSIFSLHPIGRCSTSGVSSKSLSSSPQSAVPVLAVTPPAALSATPSAGGTSVLPTVPTPSLHRSASGNSHSSSVSLSSTSGGSTPFPLGSPHLSCSPTSLMDPPAAGPVYVGGSLQWSRWEAAPLLAGSPPVFVSEVANATLNPCWDGLELGAGMQHASSMAFRLWETAPGQAPRCFCDLTVNLAELGYVAHIFRTFPPNAVLFELPDGLYARPEVIRVLYGNKLMPSPSGSLLSSSSNPPPRSAGSVSPVAPTSPHPQPLQQQQHLSTGSRLPVVPRAGAERRLSPHSRPAAAPGGSRLPEARRGPPLVPSYSLHGAHLLISLRRRLDKVLAAHSTLTGVLANALPEGTTRLAAKRAKEEEAARKESLRQRLQALNVRSSRLKLELEDFGGSVSARLLCLKSRFVDGQSVLRGRAALFGRLSAMQLRFARLLSLHEHFSAAYVEELLQMFPIEVRHLGGWSICGITLPHSEFLGSDEERVATALTFVARLVQLLSELWRRPLRYSMQLMGSRSVIRDEISASPNPRFPLYSRGVERTRFEYGVFLLNKNVEQLMDARGLGLRDLKQTLPNLCALLQPPPEGWVSPYHRRVDSTQWFRERPPSGPSSERHSPAPSSVASGASSPAAVASPPTSPPTLPLVSSGSSSALSPPLPDTPVLRERLATEAGVVSEADRPL